MSLLLSEARLAQLDAIARQKADRVTEVGRIAAWGKHGEHTPSGLVRLTDPAERQVWIDHLKRQAMNEQEGTAPGDQATAALESPIMQGAGQQ